jgi:hypothetical protein
MPLSSAERITWLMTCPSCGKGTEKPVAWLATFENLACATPDCGHVIDLKTIENRAIIQKLSNYATDLDAFFAKRD